MQEDNSQTISDQNNIQILLPDPMSEECQRYALAYRQLLLYIQNTALFTQAMNAILLFGGSLLNIQNAFSPNDIESLKSRFQQQQGIEERAAEVLSAIEAISNAGIPMDALQSGFAMKQFEADLPMLLEMIICREVDNYLAYLSEILTLIYKTNPEMLKSRQQVTIEWILEHSTMDELKSALVEKYVIDLSYLGLGKLSRDIKDRLGFELFEDDDKAERAQQIVEARNLIVHNRGVVNRLYLSRMPSSRSKLGEKICLTLTKVMEDLLFLASSVGDIERRAAKKFHLPQPIRLSTITGIRLS